MASCTCSPSGPASIVFPISERRRNPKLVIPAKADIQELLACPC